MKLQTMTVTPETAARWLESNGKNRNLNEAHVNRLAREMERGLWSLNGETVCFDETGRLLDGQHRLHAVVRSQTPVEMAVASGVKDPRAFRTYDAVQLKRGASQIAKMIGVKKNATKVASAAKVVIFWEKAKRYQEFISFLSGGGYRSFDPTPDDIAIKANEIQDEYNDIYDNLGTTFLRMGRPRSSLIAIFMILARIDPVSTQSFLDKLRTGVFANENDPVLRLRERMIAGITSSGATKSDRGYQIMLVHLTVKAWNAHVKNKGVPVLRYSPGQNEAMPVPIGSPIQ